MSREKLLVDAMLGKLARKLRIFGFNTIYSTKLCDDELLHLAKKEKRIIVTKDKQLSIIANKKKIPCIFLQKESETENLMNIKNHLNLDKFTIDMKNTRCPICNSRLANIKPDKFKIPTKILKSNDNFWQCKNCTKVYWKGSHIIKLENLLNIVNGK